MLFSDIALLDENFDYQAHRYVGVEGDRIAYIGDKAPEADYGEVYDGRGKLLMPGLYDAHAHAPMTLLRGYAEDLALDDWLNKMIFPFEAKITDEDAYPATMLAIAEMLRFGVVSFSDMYYHNDARAQAVVDSGIKANLCHTILDFAGTRYEDSADAAINKAFADRWHGSADGRLLVDMGLHAEYTSTPVMVETFAAAVHEMGLRVHVHVSETRKEVEECKARHEGRTPVVYFNDLGLFDNPTTAAHCVWLEGDDVSILAEKGVFVATNPASNAKLGSGIMDEPALREAGVRVALGTDGVASNNNHNMFKDLYLFMLMHRAVAHDPVGITPRQALRCATENGALSQGRQDSGLIETGRKADLIVLDTDVAWMWPISDMVNNVVYSAQGSDVRLTMVDGNVLYRDGQCTTIDVEKVAWEAQAIRDRIVGEV